MYTLGVNAVYHDTAACLVQDGQVVAAAEVVVLGTPEERACQ